jgi:hypothetical protein
VLVLCGGENAGNQGGAEGGRKNPLVHEWRRLGSTLGEGNERIAELGCND